MYCDGGLYKAYGMLTFMLCKAVEIPGYVYGVERNVW